MHRNSKAHTLIFTGILTLSLGRLWAQTPQVIPLEAPQLWQRAEFRVDHAPTAANNFDPDLIRLDATFTPPSGRSLTVPAFWHQEFTRALQEGAEMLTPAGPPQWRVRFTPAEPGDYTLSLSIQINGVVTGAPVVTHFNVAAATPGARHGWVRVAPDRRYFETSDSRPLRLIGENVCWSEESGSGTFDYDRWFGAMRQAGENYARLWLAPWFMGLEHQPGRLNRYDLPGAWQLDYIFRLAEQSGIYLMLCFDHHGMYQVNNPNWGGSNNFWKTNPYNEQLGGPCANPNDFFTSARAWAIYQKRLRYLIGRYGYSPNLLAWQFFNEIDNAYVYGPLKGDDVLAWHREMGRWLRTHDPYHHLVTTSLTGGSVRPEFWTLPELDFSMYHSYSDAAPARLVSTLAQTFVQQHGKPAMIGEFGSSAANWNSTADPHLRGFRQGLWGGALGGSVGTSMSWWWQDLYAENVHPLYAAMNGILRSAGWHEGTWTPVEFAGASAPPADLAGPVADGSLFNTSLPLNPARRYKLPGGFAVADRMVAERASESLPNYLFGTNAPNLQTTIKLTAFFGEHAKLGLHVRAVGGAAELVVRVDGTEALRAKLGDPGAPVAAPNETDKNVIDRNFPVEIPAGKRRVEIANVGAEWILADSLKLEQVRPAEFPGGWSYRPEAVGLRQAQKAVVYVCSPWTVYPAGAFRFNPPLQTDQVLRLVDWPAGRFDAQWFDPNTGSLIGTTAGVAAGNTLTLPLPAFRDDLAGIVIPASAEPPQQ